MVFLPSQSLAYQSKPVKSAGEVWPGAIGKEKLCQPQDERVPNGMNVCRPVISTPKAKLPLPTWTGVELELAFRTGLKLCTTSLRLIFE